MDEMIYKPTLCKTTIYKYIVYSILALVILYVILGYIVPLVFSKTNTVEKFIENTMNSNLIDHIGKDIYVTCNINNKVKYLCVQQKNNCSNLRKVFENECQNNIPILLDNKTNSCIFEIQKHPSKNMYTIRSRDTNINSPNLTQNLNYYRNKNSLCFDNDKDEEIIYFNVVNDNDGYLLVFKKDEENYFVTVCANENRCDNFNRLCLTTNKQHAMRFQFEIKEQFEQFEQFEYFDNSQNTNFAYSDGFSNVDGINSMFGIYSFGSVDSQKTLISLPGAGDIHGSTIESFKPWND